MKNVKSEYTNFGITNQGDERKKTNIAHRFQPLPIDFLNCEASVDYNYLSYPHTKKKSRFVIEFDYLNIKFIPNNDPFVFFRNKKGRRWRIETTVWD